MRDTTGLLADERSWARTSALGAIDDAVWRVTIADAALLRSAPSAYDAVLASQSDAERRQIEDTFAGLRFVRNAVRDELDVARFVHAGNGEPAGPLTGWYWTPVGAPSMTARSPRSRDWQRARYRAYQDQLARRPIGDAFSRAVAFLERAAAAAGALTSEASTSAKN
jgi:hypothetical protein